MADCNHDCSSCGENCSQRNEIQKEQLNRFSSIKKVIGVVSGKGGVGKSVITGLAACEMARRGYKVGILDADITGPSIPKIFGVHGHALGSDDGLEPLYSRNGIAVMSINILLENETDPVVWRGPVIAGVVKQFWTDVIWGDLDYLFVDMPPGTGDVPLTVYQSLPIDGILIVSSPQELVEMIVGKAAGMARMMNVPILGLVENMSYLCCPDCGRHIEIFGNSKAEKVAQLYEIDKYARMSLNPEIASCCDNGSIDSVDTSELKEIMDKVAALC